MNISNPPVRAEMSDSKFQGFLAAAVGQAPGLKAAVLCNLATDQCIEDGNGADGRGLLAGDASMALAKCLFHDEGTGPSDIGDVTEVMLWYTHWAILAIRETGKNRILAAILPSGMEVHAAVEKLSRLALANGDTPEGHGAGQLIILNGDVLQRAGSLPSAAAALADDGAVRGCLNSIFTEFGVQNPVGAVGELRDAQLAVGDMRYVFRRVPYAPDHIVVIAAADELSPAALAKIATDSGYDILRQIIGTVLISDDLQVPDTSLPENDKIFNQVVAELRGLKQDDLISLLRVGGFTNHGLGEPGEMEAGAMVYRCQECIYYLTNRRWCDLPELPVPVEPEWYCRLWKL